jgi:hypothetical protein
VRIPWKAPTQLMLKAVELRYCIACLHQFLPGSGQRTHCETWRCIHATFLVTGLQMFRKTIPVYESKQRRYIGPMPWSPGHVHGAKTSLPLLSNFLPATLAYVNQLKVLLAREVSTSQKTRQFSILSTNLIILFKRKVKLSP